MTTATKWVLSINTFDGEATLVGPYRSIERAMEHRHRIDDDIAAAGADKRLFTTLEPLHPVAEFNTIHNEVRADLAVKPAEATETGGFCP
jgi:hypothetical protein